MSQKVVCRLDELPGYLLDLKFLLQQESNDTNSTSQDASIAVLTLKSIGKLPTTPSQYAHLLLRRYALTQQLAEHGLHPPLIYERALTYESLGYADLAAADAFVTYTLCLTVRSEEWISDLEPVELSGEAWPAGDHTKNLNLLCESLVLLHRTLNGLGATEDASEKFEELVSVYGELHGLDGDRGDLARKLQDRISSGDSALGQPHRAWDLEPSTKSRFGFARREIYPWNTFEPDRNSTESLAEINSLLNEVADSIEARVTMLPALDSDDILTDGIWHQLGLFAKRDLLPGQEILRENSLLTAIRPLDDALCDACGLDLESADRQTMRQCPGEDCDSTFCSENCATRAASQYHNPNISQATYDDPNSDDENEEVHEEDVSDSQSDYPPPHAPFCGNSALHEIGRATSTTTPEWDLYFLLLTRTIQMSTTQSTHPLSLPTIKYLWGDFNPTPPLAETPSPPPPSPKRTLPWSLHHNLTLPLQFFETLMHSLPAVRPYSPLWLASFDWWTQTTLYAKFRGVANATQSTFDGKPEIAAVHPVWCLANHSCEPNVSWTPTGTRVFRVREAGEMVGEEGQGDGEWNGIKKDEEIWSHYTDVRLSVTERRERLVEVLGGICRCGRCVREAGEVST